MLHAADGYHLVLGEGAGFVGEDVADPAQLLGDRRAANRHPRHLPVPHHQETVHGLPQVQVHYQTTFIQHAKVKRRLLTVPPAHTQPLHTHAHTVLHVYSWTHKSIIVNHHAGRQVVGRCCT